MARVMNELLDSLFEKLDESEAIDEETVNALRALFASGSRLKADHFISILSTPKDDSPS